MLRILDLDTDFFSHEVVHYPDLSTRPNDADHPVWELDEVRDFLEVRCGLRGKLPGRAVTTHDEVFPLWRTALESGLLTAPFHVTHVAIIKRALEERGLYKVFIHSTVVPRLHATALRWGETRVSKFDCRLYILERT